MEEMFRCLFIGFIAGLWLSLEEAQCKSSTSHTTRTSQKLNGAGHIRCSCSIHSVSVSADQRQTRDCVDFEFEKPEPYCKKSQVDDICKASGERSPSFGMGSSYPGCSAVNQCLCIIPESQLTSILEKHKSLCFNNSYICCTVCRNDNLTTTTIATTNTTTHSIPSPINAASGKTGSTSSTTQEQSNAFSADPRNDFSDEQTTGLIPDDQTTYFSDEQANAFSPSSPLDYPVSPTFSPPSPLEGQLNPNTIFIILLLFIVVAFIIVAVVLFMRRRKIDKRNEWSPMTYTSQGDTVTNVYADVVPDNGPSEGTVPAGNHIYDELDMLTQDPTPSNVYDNTQPTSVAVDMGKSADYVDIDLPMKDQQKPMSTGKASLSLSPVYSQPFESSMSASNTEYAEPFTPGTMNTATAPVFNHSSATGDQQDDVYSLAKAIPLSDSTVIYSQPNKPTKSTGPTDESGGSTDPIHSEATGVEPGAESRGIATQDPNAVYAEPMKLKKSS